MRGLAGLAVSLEDVEGLQDVGERGRRVLLPLVGHARIGHHPVLLRGRARVGLVCEPHLQSFGHCCSEELELLMKLEMVVRVVL